MKLARRFAFCALGFALLCGCAQAQAPVTFVQLTDAHLFDDDESANFSALAWAVGKVNRLVAAGTRVDFVVYTGDLGLRTLSFPPGLCALAPLESPKASDAPAFERAVDRLAVQLDRLSVRKLYFLPGNNDLAGEQLGDMGRYQCFLSQLRARLAELAKDHSFQPMETAALEPDSALVAGGIRLLGFNDASLKDQENYQPWCSEKSEAPPPIRAACPQVQIQRLARSLDSGAPAAVFLHIPYLKDPYPPRARELPGGWDVPQTLRSEWEQTACRSNLLGIFAGHFHDGNRDLYGARGRQTLEVSECVARKSWVAPPLAEKHQEGRPQQARGLLVVTLTPGGVTGCTLYWLKEAGGSVDDGPAGSCQ
jgi:hypothetical protein